ANRWLNGQNLTARDLNATDISEVLTRSAPREDVPDIKPTPPPPFTGCGGQPLSAMHCELLAAAAQRVAQHTGQSIDLNALHTTDQAVAALDAREQQVRSEAS
ncbi:MAG: hypothetical protein ACMG6H_14925, partial [Acidobacteriota bacterium]